LQEWAALALGRVGIEHEAALTALINLVKQKEHLALRGYGVSGIAKMGADAKPAVPILLSALKEPGITNSKERRDFRVHVLAALGKIGSEKGVVPALIEILGDTRGDLDERRKAAYALKDIGPKGKEAIPTLIKVLKEKNSRVHDTAIKAVAAIGPSAIPSLLELALSEAPSISRSYAIQALGEMEDRGESALPSLRILIEDDDQRVAIAAKRAIRRIDPGR
jgi:HEAT repeat protein